MLFTSISKSFFIGDAVSDIEAALSAGCSPIYVLSTRGKKEYCDLIDKYNGEFPIVNSLTEAIDEVFSILMQNHEAFSGIDR